MIMTLLLFALLTAETPPVTGQRLQQRLAAPIDLDWAPRKWDAGIQELTKQYALNVIIDYRVNRDTEVGGQFRATALEDVLDRAAKHVHARAAVFGDIIVLGPKETVLAAVTAADLFRDRLKDLDPKRRGDWLKVREWEFDGAASVGQIVSRVAEELNWRVVGEELLEDFAPEPQRLHANAYDLIFALASQCDRTFTWNVEEREIVVADLPDNPRIEREFRFAPAKLKKAAADFQLVAPDAEFTVKSASIVVRGDSLDLRAVERVRQSVNSTASAKRSSKKNIPAKPSEPTFTLTLRNASLENFCQVMRDRQSRAVEIDADSLSDAGISSKVKLNCAATNVPLATLLRLALDPVGLRADITEDTITIAAK